MLHFIPCGPTNAWPRLLLSHFTASGNPPQLTKGLSFLSWCCRMGMDRMVASRTVACPHLCTAHAGLPSSSSQRHASRFRTFARSLLYTSTPAKMAAIAAAPTARIAGSVAVRRGVCIKAAAPMRAARRSTVKCMAVRREWRNGERPRNSHINPLAGALRCSGPEMVSVAFNST